MEILTWNEIKKKYPNPYVNLDPIEVSGSGELRAAEVMDSYFFEPNVVHNGHSRYDLFWTGNMEECPILNQPGINSIEISKHLSWKEIQDMYPHRRLGIINAVHKHTLSENLTLGATVLVTAADWWKIFEYSKQGYIVLSTTYGDMFCYAGGCMFFTEDIMNTGR